MKFAKPVSELPLSFPDPSMRCPGEEAPRHGPSRRTLQGSSQTLKPAPSSSAGAGAAAAGAGLSRPQTPLQPPSGAYACAQRSRLTREVRMYKNN